MNKNLTGQDIISLEFFCNTIFSSVKYLSSGEILVKEHAINMLRSAAKGILIVTKSEEIKEIQKEPINKHYDETIDPKPRYILIGSSHFDVNLLRECDLLIKIEDLNLPTKCKNALELEKIITVGDLIKYALSGSYINRISNIGIRTQNLILDALNELINKVKNE